MHAVATAAVLSAWTYCLVGHLFPSFVVIGKSFSGKPIFTSLYHNVPQFLFLKCDILLFFDDKSSSFPGKSAAWKYVALRALFIVSVITVHTYPYQGDELCGFVN